MSERNWSDKQKAIFAWFAAAVGHLLVRARAGTGKTTTIFEAIKHIPAGAKVLVCAFGKDIAMELRDRLLKLELACEASASTLHSAGGQIVKRYWPSCRLDADRGQRLAEKACGKHAPEEMVKLVKKLSEKAKGMAPFAKAEELREIALQHECAPSESWVEEGWDLSRVCLKARQAMDLACEKDGTYDFDDMLFLPLANNWVFPKYDFVLVDEAQDMNYSQLLLAQRVCRPRGHIVVVGDDRQAIYGFRGADANALDRLKTELNAQELPLNVTYRCGKKIVELAKALVPDYEAAEGNADGEVLSIHVDKLVEMAAPGDFILSRKNAPLVNLCLKFIKAGKKAKIRGKKDATNGLQALMKKLNAKSVPDLIARVSKWREKEAGRVRASGSKNMESLLDGVYDKADILMSLASGARGLVEVQGRLAALFEDAAPGLGGPIVLSSVHRAKGLEADRVFVLEDTLYPRRNVEEQNIEYVAITRAKSVLVWVEGLPVEEEAVA